MKIREDSQHKAVTKLARNAPRALYWATYFLTPKRRRGALALCAFFVMAYEALAGETGEGCCSSPDSMLPLLRARIDSLYPGPPELPNLEFRDEAQHALQALWETIQAYDIPQEHFHAWLDGVPVERRTLRYATWESLARQGRATSGSIALIASCVLGLTRSDAQPEVRAVGPALRLIEILRTLGMQRTNEKVELPLEDFVRARYSEREFREGVVNEGFRALVELELARAGDLLDEAEALIPWLGGEGSRVAAAMVLALSRSQLWEIKRRQDQLLSGVIAQPRPFTPRTMASVWRVAARWRARGKSRPASPSFKALQ